MAPIKILKVEAGIGFEEFSRFIRSLVSDETPIEEDLQRIFSVFDKVESFYI
jgi:Ca2+-binding EF-hand superfamily protein